MDTLCLAVPKFQTPRNKAGPWHTLHCLHNLGTVSGGERVSGGEIVSGGNPSEIQVPRYQSRTSLASRHF